MFIYYYNAKGELMNNQFVETGKRTYTSTSSHRKI